jgi:hypothetical protein
VRRAKPPGNIHREIKNREGSKISFLLVKQIVQISHTRNKAIYQSQQYFPGIVLKAELEASTEAFW